MTTLAATICDRYQWLLDRLESEFPGKIRFQAWNYGLEFGVAYIGKGFRHAIKVEYVSESKPKDFAMIRQEDGSERLEAVSLEHKVYSLNDDPDKVVVVRSFIEKCRQGELDGQA